MRIIEGIVYTVRIDQPIKQELLFGPNTGGSDFTHERFVTNGLTPFKDIEDAKLEFVGLRSRFDFEGNKIGLAQVRMNLTSSDDEWELLKESKSLIVVARVDMGYLLLGRKMDGVPGVACAQVSELEFNGFRTIKDFSRLTGSFGVIYEVRRQGRPYTSQISTFEIERLYQPNPPSGCLNV